MHRKCMFVFSMDDVLEPADGQDQGQARHAEGCIAAIVGAEDAAVRRILDNSPLFLSVLA